MIQIEKITKTFPNVTALKGVTLTIKPGEFFGLLGPNGAGKSTLMNILIGYLNADSGTISLGSEPFDQQNLNQRRKLGLVPQHLALYDELTAQQNMEIFGNLYHIPKKELQEKIEVRLKAVQLFERRKHRVGTFSGGMKRRLNIVASLLHEPAILLCDEPTVGVDPQSRNAIFDYLQLLNDQGMTIIYTTHYMEEAERMCDRIAIIDFGEIKALGTVDELLQQLPINKEIEIVKTEQTLANRDMFARWGDLTETDNDLVLMPKEDFKLSVFFQKLEKNEIGYHLIQLHRPTLEALFLHLTGRSLRE